MKIHNSTDSELKLDILWGPAIQPGDSIEYNSRIFDTIHVQSGTKHCTLTREYSDLTVADKSGLDAEINLADDFDIVIRNTVVQAAVLVSGGLDSAVTLAHAIDEYGAENVVALNITYGQVHVKETDCAEAIADHFGVKLVKEDISSVFEYAKNVCSLMQGSSIEMNDKSYAEQIAENGSPNTEIPLRNGIFLMSAASLAMSIFPNEDIAVCYGAHSDDSAGSAYPDCSPEFAAAMDEAIRIGSRGRLHVERPLIHLTKAEVVNLGLELKVPFEKTWSCYHGGERSCACCGTCLDRVNAFKANKVIDPIPYGSEVDWSGCKKIDYLEDCYV